MNLSPYKYLFLDRDGVINVERPNDYAKSIEEFVFEDNALQAIAVLSKQFDKIFVITNQRGVGRGIMSQNDLDAVHAYMLSEIEKEGGKITGVYFCSDVESSSVNRKPSIGMGFKVLEDYPEVDFAKVIMVGNSRSDIEFGNKLGMFTVLVGEKYPKGDKIYDMADAYYQNLYKFAASFIDPN